MKILTLNTHSLAEEEQERKLLGTAQWIAREKPDILGLQEVNQEASEGTLPEPMREGFLEPEAVETCRKKIALRRGNYAARLAELLREYGCRYFWTWLPVKLGYGKYDEGLAFFSLRPIERAVGRPLSRIQDYSNWKTRQALGIQIQGIPDVWFYTVHMGWWEDEEEPFKAQWDRLEACVREQQKAGNVWVMGDFNSPCHIPDQGYAYVRDHGWKDTYLLADVRDDGLTVREAIDGWRSRGSGEGMRIDYIWCREDLPVLTSRTVFNGTDSPRVSDHCGVMIQTGGPASEKNKREAAICRKERG